MGWGGGWRVLWTDEIAVSLFIFFFPFFLEMQKNKKICDLVSVMSLDSVFRETFISNVKVKTQQKKKEQDESSECPQP